MSVIYAKNNNICRTGYSLVILCNQKCCFPEYQHMHVIVNEIDFIQQFKNQKVLFQEIHCFCFTSKKFQTKPNQNICADSDKNILCSVSFLNESVSEGIVWAVVQWFLGELSL